MPDPAGPPAQADRGQAADELHLDLLVFDLDGTLVDSQQDLADAVNATLASLGRRRIDPTQVAAFIGDGAAMLVRRALGATGDVDDAVVAAAMPFFLGYYREHKLDHTRPYPGVAAALERIRGAAPGLSMAVLTNKPVHPSRGICEGLGLSTFFFQNYGGNSFPSKKPDPLGLQTLMREASGLLGRAVDPRRTVMVGDSHVDVETARAANVLCLGCSYGLDPEGLRAASPDAIAKSPEEWFDALRHFSPPPEPQHVPAAVPRR